MIKKLIAPLALVLLLSVGCKKEMDLDPVHSSSIPEENSIASRIIAPATFTQKMLLEMYGTVYCGTCPDAEQKCRIISNNNPDRVYGVALHNSDAMEIPLYNYMDSIFDPPYYASGMLNRTPMSGVVVLTKENWNKNVSTCLTKVAKCGLMINSSVTGSTASVTVSAGFNSTMTGNYRLTVYLCEDSVVGFGSGYNQNNYYNTRPGTLWYGLGNPIIGFKHDFVARKVLSSKMIGDPISASFIQPGGVFTRTYTTSISGYNKRQLYVIAFVNKTGSTKLTHQVMNVQKTLIGTNKAFD